MDKQLLSPKSLSIDTKNTEKEEIPKYDVISPGSYMYDVDIYDDGDEIEILKARVLKSEAVPHYSIEKSQPSVKPRTAQGCLKRSFMIISPYVFCAIFFFIMMYINTFSQVKVQRSMTGFTQQRMNAQIYLFEKIQRSFSEQAILNETLRADILSLAGEMIFTNESDSSKSPDEILRCKDDIYNGSCVLPSNRELFDLGFEFTRLFKLDAFFVGKGTIPDVWVVISIVATFLRLLLVEKFHIFRIGKRIVFIGGIMYFLRAISIALTVLPNPLANCYPKLHSNDFLAALLILMAQNVTCADVFYSGHTLAMTMSALIWFQYTKRTNLCFVLVFLLVGLWTVVGYAMIVMTKFHYTLDVFYGSFLTILAWYTYHFILNNAYWGNGWFITWLEGKTNRVTHRNLLKEKYLYAKSNDAKFHA